jgi:hypothetical protein
MTEQRIPSVEEYRTWSEEERDNLWQSLPAECKQIRQVSSMHGMSPTAEMIESVQEATRMYDEARLSAARYLGRPVIGLMMPDRA